MRRALRSPIDGDYSEVGVYVPPWYRPSGTRKYPLVVGLHGLNGFSMGVMRWLFGGDDPKREQGWEDRHVGALPNADAFVITPFGHGNTLYRELGETDIMHAVEWAMRRYPIDPSRVTITGMSMGGIGSAAVPLHRPHVFAAAEPLCGYHSYLIRSDVAGRALRPWERYLAEERSNVLWAENGEHLPLFIVHGTQDLPEENSGVLIERYEKLKFAVKHEHPEAGHNVWQQTYEDMKGLNWLLNRRVDLHPSHVRFKTTRTRWSTSAWVTIDELASEAGWGEVDARAHAKTKSLTATTSGVSQVTFTRDPQLFGSAAVTVTIDGQRLAFDEGEALVLGREPSGGGRGGTWRKGALAHAGLYKHGAVTGPIRDVFAEPILFVYGDGDEARANEQVARAFAKIRPGVQVSYPRDERHRVPREERAARQRPRALPRRARQPRPRRARARRAVPDPRRGRAPSRSVASASPARSSAPRSSVRTPCARIATSWSSPAPTCRARCARRPCPICCRTSWSGTKASRRRAGRCCSAAGSLRAGGLFTKEWALPAQLADPLARTPRAQPKPEKPDADPAPQGESAP